MTPWKRNLNYGKNFFFVNIIYTYFFKDFIFNTVYNELFLKHFNIVNFFF